MKPEGAALTRRHFIAVGAVGSAALASCCLESKSAWDFLSDREAAILTAICDQIIPADDFPSASEAGVLTYIDRQLARTYRRHRDAYRSGLKQANQFCRDRFGVDLLSATPQQQFAVVNDLAQKNPAFFDLVRKHTLQGYYGSPRHGGNRDAVSWCMLGLAEPPLRGRAQYDLTAGAKS